MTNIVAEQPTIHYHADYAYVPHKQHYAIRIDGVVVERVAVDGEGGWNEVAAMRAYREQVETHLRARGDDEQAIRAEIDYLYGEEVQYADMLADYEEHRDDIEEARARLDAEHEQHVRAACAAMGRAEFAPAPAGTFTRAHVGAALKQMRRHAQTDKKLLNAINRAALNVEACPWYFRQDGVFVARSANTLGLLYHVEVSGQCDCPAHGRCWHQVARELLVLAQSYADMEQVNQPAPLPLPIVVIPARVPLAA